MSTVQVLLAFCFCLLTFGLPNGAAAEPSVTTLHQTKDVALLQCDVRGASPKPTVEWQDSAGNKLPAKEPQVSERGGSYDIILQITVKKTDRYRCVATQEEINHQIDAETFVFISEKLFEDTCSRGDVTGSFLGGFSLGALTLAVLVLLVASKFITVRCNKAEDRNESRESSGAELNLCFLPGCREQRNCYKDPSELP